VRTRPLPSTTRDRWRAELGVPFALGAATVTVLAAGAVGAAWLARLTIDTLSRVLVHPEARP
jgi:hypothetical protein